jgi:CBS domain containing-hemolysin-like protein
MLSMIVQEVHPDLSIMQIGIRLGIALLLVAANGFFVAAEFALVSARRTRIAEWADDGDRRARLAMKAFANLNLYLSASQLGITLASLALGWVAESTIAAVLIQVFGGLPSPWGLLAAHTVASTIAFVTITFMHIVLGEQAPKTLAISKPEETSLWTIPLLYLFTTVFKPFIAGLNASSNLTLRIFGLKHVDEAERVHRPEEIEILVAQMYEHGRLAQEPVEMIRGVFDLSETTAAEVMTPRIQIMAAPSTTDAEGLENLFVDSGHSRLPVYEGSVDHIIGIVLARDVWRARRDRRQFNLASLIRPVPFVPETKDLEHLLREMQREGTHIAIVLDEYGGTAGLVTVEDVLEQIVGEIADEHEVHREEIHEEPDGRVLLSGRVLVADLNERYDLDLPEDEYTTVAGYVMGTLGRIAEEDDTVDFPGGHFRAAKMSGRRVELVEMLLVSTADREAED